MNEKDLLRYGEILTDDDMFAISGWLSDVSVPHSYVRIRTIAYNNHIYYTKMVNGEVVEVKELK